MVLVQQLLGRWSGRTHGSHFDTDHIFLAQMPDDCIGTPKGSMNRVVHLFTDPLGVVQPPTVTMELIVHQYVRMHIL